MNKKLLILVFLNENEKEKEIKFIQDEFNTNLENIFIYQNLDKPSQNILTFYAHVEVGEFLNVKDYFNNAIIVHKKKKTFYTINALNKLIEVEHNLEVGNIDYKKWSIDWSKYEDTLILNSNNNLSIIPIKRVFS